MTAVPGGSCTAVQQAAAAAPCRPSGPEPAFCAVSRIVPVCPCFAASHPPTLQRGARGEAGGSRAGRRQRRQPSRRAAAASPGACRPHEPLRFCTLSCYGFLHACSRMTFHSCLNDELHRQPACNMGGLDSVSGHRPLPSDARPTGQHQRTAVAWPLEKRSGSQRHTLLNNAIVVGAKAYVSRL